MRFQASRWTSFHRPGQPGVMRADGRVSVAAASCTGLGDQGPALLVNHHQVVTRLDAERVARIAELVAAEVPPAQWPAEWSVVADNVRRPDVLLGSDFAPGDDVEDGILRLEAVRRMIGAMVDDVLAETARRAKAGG